MSGIRQTVEARSALLEQWVEAASREYRNTLQQKATDMRAAVRAGETGDTRVLAVADALERLAANRV